MKKLLLFSLFLACNFSSVFSQNYIPLPTANACWIDYNNAQYGATNTNVCDLVRIEIVADTIINNTTYQILKRTTESRNGIFNFPCSTFVSLYTDTLFMRNDSVNKKVFIRTPYLNADSLLYDFNISVGDTIKESFQYQNHSGSFVLVVAKDSILVSTKYHKRFKLIHQLSLDSIFLIEGIGSSRGLLNTYDLFPSSTYELQCFNENGLSVFPTFASNCNVLTSIEINSQEKSTISITPNPAKDILNIESPHPIESVQVINLQGQIIKEFDYPATSFDISELDQGLYVLSVHLINGHVLNQKVIKH